MKFSKLILLTVTAILVPFIIYANTGQVKTVFSGDHIEFSGGFKVRLVGIKTPDKSTEMGYKVYDFTKRELEGKTVKLFTYTTDNTAAGIVYDKEGYAYAQIVYGEGTYSKNWSGNFNELLLEKGYAQVDRDFLPEEFKHFLDIEKKAREQKIGIWKNEKQ
ncbi:thermonuclease family protein [candidate division KSB1 bacterium]|nr:thermonuclease family protein [candidate division KSB1 bacterium]